MSDMPRTAPPNWYPDPQMLNTLRYWDGRGWTQHIAPMSSRAPDTARQLSSDSRPKRSRGLSALILVGSVVGLIISLQSASLLTGTGSLWMGAAIACGAAIASWFMGRSVPGWLKILATVVAVIALANVVMMEAQMEQKRQEISSIFK